MKKLYLETIKKHLSADFVDRKESSEIEVRKHPIEELIYSLEHEKTTPLIFDYSLFTAESIYNIEKEEKFQKWFKEKWKEAEERKDNNNKAVSVLSEYRALYSLLSTRKNIIPLSDHEKNPNKKNNSSPDFKLEAKENIFFEVFTPRVKKDALDMLKEFYSDDTTKKENPKKISISMIGYNSVYEGCAGNDASRVYTIKKRIVSNKFNADQAYPNASNILWIDLVSREWNHTKKDAKPLIVLNNKGETFTGTKGIWHSFYGDKKTQIIKNPTVLKYNEKNNYINQTFKGYFYENNKWSGVILAFSDGIVFFENPFAENPLNKKQREYLTRIDKFDMSLSWLNISDGFLLDKINNTKKELDFLKNITQ